MYINNKIKNKHVILRADLDVPLSKNKISDNSRILAMLPTIELLRKNKCKIIIIGHLGRPKGIDNKLKMNVVAKEISSLLKIPIFKLDKCIGKDVNKFVKDMESGEIAVLENLRFYKEEINNSKTFAKKLSSLAEIYVNDCFSTMHRKHASIVGIKKIIPSYFGLNVKNEIENLNKLNKPKKPYIAILGAAKISDKIELIDKLCKKVDKLLLGGAIIFTFYKALHLEVGKSLVDESKINECRKLLKKYNNKIILPIDVVVGNSINSKKGKVIHATNIPKSKIGLDIGPESIDLFKSHLKKAKSIFWNGPLGVFENKAFENGTKKIAKCLHNLNKLIIIGGGDTSAALKKFKLNNYTHISTAGGASIEYIEGKKLPGFTHT